VGMKIRRSKELVGSVRRHYSSHFVAFLQIRGLLVPICRVAGTAYNSK